MSDATLIDRETAAGCRADSWLPSFDLHEEDGEMVVHADLDGLAGEDFDIALDGDRLVLRGSGGGNGAHWAWLALPFVPRQRLSPASCRA
jgi:HSP20 family molecular chaperone IbpA